MLGKFPGYMMMKSIAADFGGAQSDSGMQPALVSFDDNTVLGYIVEDAGAAGLLTVFIPSAPSAGSGSVVMVPRERVRPLECGVERRQAHDEAAGRRLAGTDPRRRSRCQVRESRR